MTDEPEKLWTIQEVGRYLHVDDTTVRRWIKARFLDGISLPHRGKRCIYRIKQSTLDALLSGNNTHVGP